MLRNGGQEARFLAVRYRCPDSLLSNHPYPDSALDVEIVIDSDVSRDADSLAVTLYDRYGTKLVNADTIIRGESIRLERGQNSFLVRLDALHLKPGRYVLGLWLAGNHKLYDHIASAAEIEVADSPSGGFGQNPRQDGIVTCKFSVEKIS